MKFDIADGVLKKAWGYDESTVVPEGVTCIAEGVFASFCDLKSLTLPDGLTEIEDHAFNDCQALESIYLPDSVEKLGEYAFQYCKRLKRIRFSPRMTAIECSTFRYCLSLKEISIPAGIISIDYDAFYGCKELESVTICASTGEFGRRLFEGCGRLVRLDAPAGAINTLGEERRAEAAVRFCRSADSYQPHAREAYRAYISRCTDAFMAAVTRNDDDAALYYAASERLIPADAVERFTACARRDAAYKCVSILMGYADGTKTEWDDALGGSWRI